MPRLRAMLGRVRVCDPPRADGLPISLGECYIKRVYVRCARGRSLICAQFRVSTCVVWSVLCHVVIGL